MSIIILLLGIYLLFSLFSLGYTKNDFISNYNYSGYTIVVLGIRDIKVFEHRIKTGKKLKALLGLPIIYTGCDNFLNLPNFLVSKHTLDDAIKLYELIGDSPLIIITNANHIRRAYFTFKNVFKTSNIICKPTNDLLKRYGPLSPTGRWFVFLNFKKNYIYNKSI